MKRLLWILCFAAHLSQAAITQIEMDKAINKLRYENRDYDRLWKFLKSIGWKVAVQNNLSQGVQMTAGQPLTLKIYSANSDREA